MEIVNNDVDGVASPGTHINVARQRTRGVYSAKLHAE